jgi:hypothetical protein
MACGSGRAGLASCSKLGFDGAQLSRERLTIVELAQRLVNAVHLRSIEASHRPRERGAMLELLGERRVEAGRIVEQLRERPFVAQLSLRIRARAGTSEHATSRLDLLGWVVPLAIDHQCPRDHDRHVTHAIEALIVRADSGVRREPVEFGSDGECFGVERMSLVEGVQLGGSTDEIAFGDGLAHTRESRPGHEPPNRDVEDRNDRTTPRSPARRPSRPEAQLGASAR